ncbi:MAG: 30S ribosomal protein S6, partial [Parcubacteria group bacterium CG_4_10_14_0_8_um_filter_35_7]
MHYELLYIIPAKYSEKELQPVINQVIPLIKKAGGEILRDDNLGRKKLAYP